MNFPSQSGFRMAEQQPILLPHMFICEFHYDLQQCTNKNREISTQHSTLMDL